MRRGNMIGGAILIAIGILFLLKNMNILNYNVDIFSLGFLFSHFWALIFLMIPGIIFHLGFFSSERRNAGLLVPGGILLFVGATCQISTLFGLWNITWPGFIMAVAFGLFELYLFGGRKKGLLIPVCILGGISLIFFVPLTLGWIFDFASRRLFVPVILVLIGLAMIFGRGSYKKGF